MPGTIDELEYEPVWFNAGYRDALRGERDYPMAAGEHAGKSYDAGWREGMAERRGERI
jgi:hypothetical protein